MSPGYPSPVASHCLFMLGYAVMIPVICSLSEHLPFLIRETCIGLVPIFFAKAAPFPLSRTWIRKSILSASVILPLSECDCKYSFTMFKPA